MIQPAPDPQDVRASAWAAASSADAQSARSALLDIFSRNEAALRSDGYLFASVLHAALAHRNLDAASELISVRWGTGSRIALREGDTGHAEALRWVIRNPRDTTLWLNPHLLGSAILEGYACRLTGILAILTAYVLDEKCETGEAFFNIGDHGYVPGLAFSDQRPEYFLVPDALYLLDLGYAAMRNLLAAEWIPWERRAPIAFWRGVTTGYPEDPSKGWLSIPRVRLCAISSDHPDLLDAGISQAVQGVSEEALRALGFMRSFAPQSEFVKYKYQIDIDGNTNSWPGLFLKLLTGSPVLKVMSPYRQWYYDRLKPWSNYVPVAGDLSDLMEKLTWLRQHDDAARRVGEAGRALAESLDYRGEIARSLPVVAAALRQVRATATLSNDNVPRPNGDIARPIASPAESRQPDEAGPVYLVSAHGRLVGRTNDGRIAQLERKAPATGVPVALREARDGRRIEEGPLTGFTVRRHQSQVSLERDGRFLCAEPDGRLVADRTACGPWETFTLAPRP